MGKLRGNQRLTGSWSRLWVNGIPILEFKKIEVKVSVNREDVQMGIDVDSKMTGLKGEWNMTVGKVYSSYNSVMKDFTKGKDTRMQLMAKLADPDAVNSQEERWSFDNCWINELPLFIAEKGALIDEELSGGFTPSDAVNLDEIKR